jgi:hypothetical protein
VIPNILVAGVAAGLLSHRPRTLSVVAAVLGVIWAFLIAVTTASAPNDIPLAFGLAVANAVVGIGIGLLFRLSALGLSTAVSAIRREGAA